MDKAHQDLPVAQGPRPTEASRRTRLWMLAGSGVLLLVIGALILLVGKGRPSEVAANHGARSTADSSKEASSKEASPADSMSASEAEFWGRIIAIISDAHSGRYFANDFEHTYSAGMESALVQGMGHMSERYARPADKRTDEMVACMLSYVETTIRSHGWFAFDVAKVEAKATAQCTTLGIK